MRRTITYVAVWFAAGVGAITLGMAAVAMVGNQVTGSRPSPLSADEVRDELSGDTDSTTTTLPDSSTTTLPPGGATSTISVAATTPTSTQSGPGGTPNTAGASSAQPETRTYSLVGGTVTLRFEASGVTVQEATPRPGYEVEDLEPTHGNGWKVEFRSDDHRSRVEGWWDAGPRDEVREEEG